MDEKTPVDSKFRFVLVTSGRAEQLMRGARPKVDAGNRKSTTVAMDEVAQGLVDWDYGPPPAPPEEAAAEGSEAAGEPEGEAAGEVH
jgi:DNA-directed RNA polymerase subunit K/omega